MKRINPSIFVLLIGVAACDINLGGGDDGGDGGDGQGTGASSAGVSASGPDSAGDEGGTGGPNGGPDDSAGSEDGPGGDPSGGAEDPDGDSGEAGETTAGLGDMCNEEADCQSCFQCSILPGNNCSASAEACTAEPACTDMIDCQSSCAFGAANQEELDVCVGFCAADAQIEGLLLFNDLLACRETTCTNTCFGAGSACDFAGDCQACVNCSLDPGAACEPFLAACNADFDCVDLLTCQQDCFGTSATEGELNACLVNCDAFFPGGIDLLGDLNGCTTAMCPVSCEDF